MSSYNDGPPPPYSENASKPLPNYGMETPYGPVEPKTEKMRPADGEFISVIKNPYSSSKPSSGSPSNSGAKNQYPNNSSIGGGSSPYPQGPPLSVYPPNVGGGTSSGSPYPYPSGGRGSPYSGNIGGGTSTSGPYQQPSPYPPTIGSGANSTGPYPAGGRISPYSRNIGSGTTTSYASHPNAPIGGGSYQNYPPGRMPSPGLVGSGASYQRPYSPPIGGGATQGYHNINPQMPVPHGSPIIGSGATGVGYNQSPRPIYDQSRIGGGYSGPRPPYGPGFANDHVAPLSGRMDQMNIGAAPPIRPYYPGSPNSGGYYNSSVPQGSYSTSGHVGGGGNYYSSSNSTTGYISGGSCTTGGGGYCSSKPKKSHCHHSHHHHHC